jgi:thioredoxin-related protein
MRKYFFILLIFFWAMLSGFAQLKIHSFEEAEKLSIENPKPMVVFIHTSWCNYCKMMENSTFKNQEIIALLNTAYYFVSLDAESKDDITFNAHTFKFKPTGQNTGIHELAVELATIGNEVIYPTLTILDTDYSILLQTSSFKDAKTTLILLKEIENTH